MTLCFAHAAYRMGDRFALRESGLDWFEVRTRDDLAARIGEVDVLVVSGLWRNELIAAAPRLTFIQSISAGTDRFSREALRAAGIRLASAQGAETWRYEDNVIDLLMENLGRLARGERRLKNEVV